MENKFNERYEGRNDVVSALFPKGYPEKMKIKRVKGDECFNYVTYADEDVEKLEKDENEFIMVYISEKQYQDLLRKPKIRERIKWFFADMWEVCRWWK